MSHPTQYALRHTPSAEEFVAAQHSAEFQELRHKQRSFTFPLTVLFLAWFILYVLLAMYAPSFLSIKVFGNVNLGILMGLGQFLTTFLITWAYVKYADKALEPRARAIRERLERSAAAEPAAAQDAPRTAQTSPRTAQTSPRTAQDAPQESPATHDAATRRHNDNR
ncbi:DUF485 domain-containing protein [Corynebacterium heidelbergense]|uniref:DUF485 domain-containing protein n=1 Tax=Corynebacterium heidelbergense TaxID=2055947 RepID=A0A364V3M4_9CORY|nr:DUF485 domain-containing protein [Corynebacterium heidelbergense]